MYQQNNEMFFKRSAHTYSWVVLLLTLSPCLVSAAENLPNTTTTKPGHLLGKATTTKSEEANHDPLQSVSHKARVSLRQANAHLSRSVRQILRGQQAQKQGRQLKIKGKKHEGEAKILMGQKLIDEALKQFSDAVAQIKNTQHILNAATDQEVQIRSSAKTKKDSAKTH